MTNFTRVGFENVCGTSLDGYVTRTLAEMVEAFGEPHRHVEGGDKTDAEWVLRFDDGTIATIYNYKDGKNYLGDEGLAVEDIAEWHIGGLHTRRGRATELVHQVIAEVFP